MVKIVKPVVHVHTVTNKTETQQINKSMLPLTGVEGRAGMVAIVEEEGNVDLKDLHFKLQSALPPYAHPIFVRKLHKLDTTGMDGICQTFFLISYFPASP